MATKAKTKATKKPAKAKKWVYLFDEVKAAEKYAGNWEGVRSLLGGKGSGLADMTRAGVPVPLASRSRPKPVTGSEKLAVFHLECGMRCARR